MKSTLIATIALINSAYAIRLHDDGLKATFYGGEYQKAGEYYGGPYFNKDYSGFPGTKDFAPEYERKIPVVFEDHHLDDMFMNSMIKTYSKERRNPVDGSPTGKFFLDKVGARQAAEEIVHTHLKLSG